MPQIERTPLAGGTERVLEHEPRSRDEIALAVGYAGRRIDATDARPACQRRASDPNADGLTRGDTCFVSPHASKL